MSEKPAARPIRVGAVAYDPKAVTIWEGIRAWFAPEPIPLDFILFSSYEAQVDALFARTIEVAWNTPVAWVRCQHRAEGRARALAMRDVDVEFRSVLVAAPSARIAKLPDLTGKTVALGSRDSAQAAILPAWHIERAGLVEGRDWKPLRFDVDVGKHGDTGTSELEVVKAIESGRAEAGTIGDATWARLLAERQVDPARLASVHVFPAFSHCNFTALPDFDLARERAFVDRLLAMDHADPRCRPVMDLEGLKRWVPGRTDGYAELTKAMTAKGLL